MKKITFNREGLSDALGFGAMYAGTNKTSPTLDNIILAANPSSHTVSIGSSDMSISVTTAVDADVDGDEKFSFCVNPKTLKPIVSTLSCDTVDLIVGDDVCELKYPSGSAKLPVFDASEYPSKENETRVHGLTIRAETLSYILSTCKGFVGNDELRPAMSAVYFEVKDGCFEYCSTDAHRLVTEKMLYAEGEHSSFTGSFMVHKMSIPALLLAAKDGGLASIYVGESSISFDFGNKNVTCSIPAAKYPNFRPMLSGLVDNTNKSETSRDELKRAILRASMCANVSTKTIKVTIGESVIVQAEDLDYGKTIMESVGAVSHEGEQVSFGMNASYMHDCVDVVDADTIGICVSMPNRAVVFYDKNHAEKTILLMPVMLN